MPRRMCAAARLRYGARAISSAQPGVMEVARPEKVVALFKAASGKREGFAAWHLLFYALWHRRHVEGVLPDGADTFSYLAAR